MAIKADIVESIYEQFDIPKRSATAIVDGFFEIIREQLSRGEPVKLSGFGNFTVQKKSARQGRNPKTRQEVEIASRQIVSFRASDGFRQQATEKAGRAAKGVSANSHNHPQHRAPHIPPGGMAVADDTLQETAGHHS
jgi:integration host factor subunit alpha